MKHSFHLVNRKSVWFIDFVNYPGQIYDTIEGRYEKAYRRLLTVLGRTEHEFFVDCTAGEQDVLMAFSAWFSEWSACGLSVRPSHSRSQTCHPNSVFFYVNRQTGHCCTFIGYFNDGYGETRGLNEWEG